MDFRLARAFLVRLNLLGHLRFVVLRGRPTFRFLTASRSFGSISHIIPTLIAFKRPRAIIARTLLGVTFSRLAASAVLMSFTAKVYHSGEMVLPRNNFY